MTEGVTYADAASLLLGAARPHASSVVLSLSLSDASCHDFTSLASQDELRLMRIRTKRHELIITPGGLPS